MYIVKTSSSMAASSKDYPTATHDTNLDGNHGALATLRESQTEDTVF